MKYVFVIYSALVLELVLYYCLISPLTVRITRIEKVLLQTTLKYGLSKCVLLPSFSSEVHSKDLISQSSV